MPVIDYRCNSCSHVDSKFIPASQCGSDHPKSEVSRCSKCRHKSERIYDASPTIGFSPIVVHLNTKTGLYSFPGHPDDELPDADYTKVSITSMRDYERVRSGVESVEREKAQFLQSVEREYFDTAAKRNREATRLKMEDAIRKGGHWVQETDDKGITRTRWAAITPRARALFDAACKMSDARREDIRRKREYGSPNFHSRALEYRESERSVVTGTAKRPDVPSLKELAERYERMRRR